jgi:glycosyltransferase involved in cell wall biosynthesis
MFCYYYPPLGGIGSQRSQKFARYLGDYGWQPVVITPQQGCYFVDPSLDDGTARGVEVIRTGAINISSLLKQTVMKRSSDGAANVGAVHLQPNADGAMLGFLKRAVRTWVYIPDGQIGWFPYALRAARRAMAQGGVEAIFSSSFPVTAHLLAYRLKQATGKPWIADFRDLWTENHYADYSSRLRKRIDQKIEAKLLEQADVITTVSDEWAETLRRMTGGKRRIEVIRNGFDASEFAPIESRRPDKWTITYVGLFYGAKQDPSTFLEALRRVINSGKVARDNVRFNIVGEPDSYVQEMVARFGVADITNFTGFVSHPESLAQQVNSSLLLLIVHKEQTNAGHVPGKLYEYLGARRRILALAHQGFEAARLINESRAGIVVESTDIAGIEQALIDSYSAYQSGDDAAPSDSDLSRYERKPQAGQLASLLDELATPPRAEGERLRSAWPQTY